MLFAALAAAIWFAGTRLSHLADAIGDKTGAGQAIMGLIFLAAITEVPELVTTSTAALGGNAALALNNMFGGITMQTAILVVADAAALHVTLTSVPRKSTPVLEAAFLILLLAAMSRSSVGLVRAWCCSPRSIAQPSSCSTGMIARIHGDPSIYRT